MKILIVTSDIYPFQKGYGGRNPINIYDALSKMGHDVKLMTSVPHYGLEGADLEEMPANIDFIRLYSTLFQRDEIAYLLPPFFSEVKKIKQILRDGKFDLILLNDYIWSISALSLILMGKTNRRKTILINHGIIKRKGFVYEQVLQFFNIVVAKILLRDFKGILSYSNTTYKELGKILPASLKHIVHPLCIDYSKFRADYERSLSTSFQEIREKFRISGGFIFSISSISPHKGYEVLINAFSHLLEQYPNIDLVLAGQMTQYGKQLRKLCDDLGISKNVRFVGTISDPEKFNLMMKSTIFVIPSLREGFGAGAMEADVLQVKVVATDTGAHKEILSANRFSRIVEPGNSIELYNAIDDLISIKEEPARTLDVAKLCRYSCESLCEAILSEFN